MNFAIRICDFTSNTLTFFWLGKTNIPSPMTQQLSQQPASSKPYEN
jgi:hypothetical protein